LIIGENLTAAIGTLVEHTTRTIQLRHLPQRDSDTLHDAMNARMSDLPAGLLARSPGHGDGPPSRDKRVARCVGLPLRLPLNLAARLERERQRAAA
jgi:IS30 family transposase